MIDFPLTEVMDETAWVAWLEHHLHPTGFVCPHCGSRERRFFREQKYFPAYRCRTCDGYDTLLRGTAFEKSRQNAATLVLLLRGSTKGESAATLAREIAMSRQNLGPLRRRVIRNLDDTAPIELMLGTAFEAGEVSINAGEKNKLQPDPQDPPRRRANKAKGMGTFANDRPPVLGLGSRQTGEHRYFVCDSARKALCHQIIHENGPAEGTILDTDGLKSYRDARDQHAWGNHAVKEWARDDNGDGVREVHCKTCAGAGAALRTALRVFRGVHKDNVHLDVVPYETMRNAKRIS